jgi:hypothetical protein
MAFGAALTTPSSPTTAPPLPSATARGFGIEPVDALAVWSLAVPAGCSSPALVGLQHETQCPGRFFEGSATLLANSSCEDLCRQTPGCRSYTVWPTTEGGERHCRASYSRCVAPQYRPSCWDGQSTSCGEDNTTYVRAFSLSQETCTLSLHVQLPGSASRPGRGTDECFEEVSYLGHRSGRQHRVAHDGVLQVVGVEEAPMYLVRTACRSSSANVQPV